MDTASSSSSSKALKRDEEGGGSESGWVEALRWCRHVSSALSSNEKEIEIEKEKECLPKPDTVCNMCQHQTENWVCLSCKVVLCGRFVNKHMLHHYHQNQSHSLALSFSDLSVWCFSCDAYLDAPLIPSLRPIYQLAYLLKFGENPPLPHLELQEEIDNKDKEP